MPSATSKIAFFGNPGAGKSTLLNCLMVMRHGQVNGLFKSGISIAKGLTYKFSQKEINGFVYMDTPGLDDVEMREQAAQGISTALKQDGDFLIIFVVTQSAGKIPPCDFATIKTVLEAAPEITSYGVIVNKLSNPVYDAYSQQQNKDRLEKMFKNIDTRKKVSLLFLRNISALEDASDETAPIPDLKTFVDSQPLNSIRSINVDRVDLTAQNLESQIEVFRLQQENSIAEFERQKRLAEENRQQEQKRQEDERRRQRIKNEQRIAEQERCQQEQRRRQAEESQRAEQQRQADIANRQRIEQERIAEMERQRKEAEKQRQEEIERLAWQQRRIREREEEWRRGHVLCVIS